MSVEKYPAALKWPGTFLCLKRRWQVFNLHLAWMLLT